jgi:hypothetical protein
MVAVADRAAAENSTVPPNIQLSRSAPARPPIADAVSLFPLFLLFNRVNYVIVLNN